MIADVTEQNVRWHIDALSIVGDTRVQCGTASVTQKLNLVDGATKGQKPTKGPEPNEQFEMRRWILISRRFILFYLTANGIIFKTK